MAKPQQQRPQRSKQTSILLTFCILQFVRQLRRRVKPRVLDGSIDARRLGITLSGIAGGPSPSINVQDAKQMRRVALRRRRCKSQHSHHDNPDLVRSSRHLRTPASAAPASRNLAGDKVQQMLCAVDGKLNATGNAFSSIASNSALFLKHNNASIVEGRSMGETIQLLAAVHDAVNVLFDCREQYGDDWLLAQGLDAGLELDENFIANYEHLLLRLQADLIEALSRKALEELLHGSHDKKQRKLLSWFTEFAAKPQALSTSFPWTIKPSLAVLWGVCWMYYGRCEDERARSGSGSSNRDRVPLDAVLQSIQLPWDTGASSDYVNLGRQLIGEPSQRDPHAANMGVGLEHDMFQARNTETWESDLALDGRTGRLPALMVSQAGSRADPLPLPNPDTYFDAASPYGPVVSPINNLYSPQSPGTAAPLKVFPHLGTTHHHDPWLHASPPQDTPRHLINPSIAVTGASESQFFAPPQIAFASSPIYPPTGQPQAPPLNLQPPYFSYNNTPSFIMADIATSPANAPVMHEHKRTASTASIASITGDMPTPVSMGCPRSPMTSPTAGETQAAAPSPQRPHNRSLSIDSSQDGDDDGSLRKNHSYKRAEEPPRNQDGKMICKYQECNGVSFDRKCEWSKHMDKHDRPYKCNAKGCEKLQGFTYSGGLLRHEREVHKLHGGTKKSLFCPFPDCKRSSGAGFTRKENLAEHIRRVHRRTSMSADLHGLVIRRDMVRREMEGSPIPEPGESESPYSRPMEFREEDEMSLKRKRAASDSGPTDRVNDEMRTEIKRLRQENEEKDSRLKQLEQAVMALQQQGRK